MSAIRASITIDLPDGADYMQYVSQLKSQISNLTGLDTRINIRDVDDPISLSPTFAKKVGKENE